VSNRILIPCDECLELFSKNINTIRKNNFCCRKCMDMYNSKRFNNYNIVENPMNGKGRTIDQRFEISNRRKNAKDRVGKDCRTYKKQLGEPEHRKIMRIKMGRELTYDEVVHHIDGNPLNNKPSNLKVMSRREHTSLHLKEYWSKKRNEKK